MKWDMDAAAKREDGVFLEQSTWGQSEKMLEKMVEAWHYRMYGGRRKYERGEYLENDF